MVVDVIVVVVFVGDRSDLVLSLSLLLPLLLLLVIWLVLLFIMFKSLW